MERLVWTCGVVALGLLAGCSSATSGSGHGAGGGAAQGGSGGFTSTGGSGGTGAIGFDGGGGTGGYVNTGCSQAAQYVYVIDAQGSLYKFDPPALKLTFIGLVNCNTPLATPFSMAVDRNAQAWVVFTSGRLFKVDTSNAACTQIPFTQGQQGFLTFGMGFSTDGPGSATDTLYVTNSDFTSAAKGLAKIDQQSLVLTKIGAYDQLSSRAEMTGTGDGRLYGAFEGTPYIVAEIDKTNAHIKSQAPQTPIQYPPNGSNFAFAFWGGHFWLFVGPGTKTDIFEFDPVAASTTLRTSVPQEIVGAGVSTCAPTEPPK